MQRVQKKLREARFFLAHLSEQSKRAFGGTEPLDFYLSAFLNAARCVEYMLHRRDGGKYGLFRDQWIQQCPPERSLIDFMREDRNCEVHRDGSRREERERRIPVFGSYSDPSGSVTTVSLAGIPPSEIVKPEIFFTIDGQQLDALDACHRYIDLLGQLVSDYCRLQEVGQSR